MSDVPPGRSAQWPWLFVLLAGGVMVWGLLELFAVRFARGDVYPAYSSLRSDPQGVKLWYEGLAGADLAVERNLRDLAQTPLPAATIYIVGIRSVDFAGATQRRWQSVLAAVENEGARLVVVLAPVRGRREEISALASSDREPDSRKEEEESEAIDPTPTLFEKLGVAFAWQSTVEGDDAPESRAIAVAEATTLPPELPWNSTLVLASADAAWRSLYTVQDRAVALERTLGRGSVVLWGDASLLRNAALAVARQPGLLAWLQGAHPRAVFDESHLGINQNPGVVALARSYRLEHAAFVLGALALLYLWRRATSLVPPGENARAGGAEPDEFVGRDAAAGFVSLLRRTLHPRDLFATCWREYRRSTAWRRLNDAARSELSTLAAALPASPDPLVPLAAAHRVLTRQR